MAAARVTDVAQGSERHTDSFLCLSLDISGIYTESCSSLQKKDTTEIEVLPVPTAQK